MGDQRTPLDPGDRTLGRLLELEARARGDNRLFTIDGVSMTVEQTRSMGARRAGAFRAAGIGEGDRVAVLAPNCVELVELFVGCAWNGSVLVPINVAAHGEQLEYLINNVSPSALVVSTAALVEHEAVLSRLNTVKHLWCIGDESSSAVGVDRLPEPGPEIDRYAARPGDTLAILYTSGTTGPSKGVCCPNAQMYWWGVNTAAALGVSPEDVIATCLPLYHTNALNTLLQALTTGSSLVFSPRFSASRFWEELAQSSATVTYVLGAMISILLKTERRASDSTHRVRVALAPGTPPSAWAEFEDRFGVELVEGHGMTETNLAIGPRERRQRRGYMGRVMPGFEARVVDDQDNQVPDGAPGELVLRAFDPFAFATGYFGLPDETVAAWRNLWFHTGDRVIRDADGYYQFIDRIKDIIRRRGENISAWEVEQALVGHWGVVTAAAIPVPSELGDDEVMAVVVCRDGFHDPVELLEHCKSRLPYYAVPRYVEFVDSLPLTANGKIQKSSLKARGVSERTWDRETGLQPSPGVDRGKKPIALDGGRPSV